MSDAPAKDRMLAALDQLRRKIETGEVVGIVLGSVRTDDYYLSRTVGKPPGPHGILVLESILAEAKEIFLDNNRPDDGGPLVGAVPSRDQEGT